MLGLSHTVTDLHDEAGAELLRTWSYGVIEIADEKLVGVHLRPWPTLVSVPEVWLGQLFHRWTAGNRCWIYYNVPFGCPSFLAVTYAASYRDTTLGTIRLGMETLDRIAAIRRTDALVCEISLSKIPPALCRRWGWEPHCANQIGLRHFIKRFYGEYPKHALANDESQTAVDEPALLLR